MPDLHAVAVYCGSSSGIDPVHRRIAGEFGAALAGRGLTLVYGGGHVGLMGAVADAALEAGGTVHGVITRSLVEREIAHAGLQRLDVVETMHERKARMTDLADAVVALPGGFGTLDEFFESITWMQLGMHSKPSGLVDVDGFYAPLLSWIDTAVAAGFIHARHRDAVLVDSDPVALLDRLAIWDAPVVAKWLDPTER